MIEATLKLNQFCGFFFHFLIKKSFYRPQRSWAKVMFLQACVCPQEGGRGVCLSACWDTPQPPPPGADTPQDQAPPRADTPGADTPPQEQTTPRDQAPPQEQTPRDQAPPPGSRLQHMVNERPVRILLECILVDLKFPTDVDKNVGIDL